MGLLVTLLGLFLTKPEEIFSNESIYNKAINLHLAIGYVEVCESQLCGNTLVKKQLSKERA